MSLRITDGDITPLDAEAGRSLWRDAWGRLKANRAAMASLVFLAAMALTCIVGPYLLPHRFDTEFRDYIRAPASLAAYPTADQIEPSLVRNLRSARTTLAGFTVIDDDLLVQVTSTRPIDPRLPEYLNRGDLFEDARITETGADGRSATLAARIEYRHFYFGTDNNGRDLLARTLVAGRISLAIGILATTVALVIGVAYGAISGYLGGRADLVMMRVVDVLYSLPFIFFVILLVVFFGRNFFLMLIAVGAIEWLDMARIVRGQTLSLKRQEYVQAAQAMGVRRGAIIRRHVIPNLLGPVVVYVTLLVPRVILLESFLSFLSLGVQEPMTSWGVLISAGAANIPGAWWMLIFPALFLTTTLIALNFVGDGLRDALDPKDR